MLIHAHRALQRPDRRGPSMRKVKCLGRSALDCKGGTGGISQHNPSACHVRTGESVVVRPEFGKTRLAYAGLHGVYQRARHKFAERRHVAWPGTFDWSVRVLRPVGNAVRLK